jgi:hypothetical protein
MGERFSRAEQLEHRVQMQLGIFPTKGVLPLEFSQRLDELEEEAERKGGVLQALSDHFARVYKVSVSLAA